MENQQLADILQSALNLQDVRVTGDGSHFEVLVVGEQFEGLSSFQRQKAVYKPLMEYIAGNQVHAVVIKAFSPVEWQRDRKLLGL